MAVTPVDPQAPKFGNDTVLGLVRQVDEFVAPGGQRGADAEYYGRLGELLRRLHASMRAENAAKAINHPSAGSEAIRPEFAADLARLGNEHVSMLGMLDRLIRASETMADRSLEDREVFFLRVRELLAILRRHEAEEERVMFLSMWADTGGES